MPSPEQERCGNCKFFLALASSDEPGKGLCRFNPPKQVSNRIGTASDDGRWPLCFATEWCAK